MPLHTPDRKYVMTESLCNAIGTALFHVQLFSHTRRRLMMGTVDRTRFTAHIPQQSRGMNHMQTVFPSACAIGYGIMSGYILQQCSTEIHIDTLHSPAHTQNGLFQRNKHVQKKPFPCVTVGFKIAGSGIQFPVTPWFQISAAG